MRLPTKAASQLALRESARDQGLLKGILSQRMAKSTSEKAATSCASRRSAEEKARDVKSPLQERQEAVRRLVFGELLVRELLGRAQPCFRADNEFFPAQRACRQTICV